MFNIIMLQLVDKLAILLDIIMFEINACVAGFSLDTVSWSPGYIYTYHQHCISAWDKVQQT